jgi:Cdc6-like AAA superfamily ATPase
VGKKPFVIVLDEIDQPKADERDTIIYNLCNLGNVGLVASAILEAFWKGWMKGYAPV